MVGAISYAIAKTKPSTWAFDMAPGLDICSTSAWNGETCSVSSPAAEPLCGANPVVDSTSWAQDIPNNHCSYTILKIFAIYFSFESIIFLKNTLNVFLKESPIIAVDGKPVRLY